MVTTAPYPPGRERAERQATAPPPTLSSTIPWWGESRDNGQAFDVECAAASVFFDLANWGYLN